MLFDFETVSVVRLKGVRHGAISIGATATPGIAKIGVRSAWGCNSKAHTPPDAEALGGVECGRRPRPAWITE
jgi:hypothetical protein